MTNKHKKKTSLKKYFLKKIFFFLFMLFSYGFEKLLQHFQKKKKD